MNRIYRSVWNEITRTFVAAAETVRGRGKPASGVCAEATPASRSGAVLARRRPMMLALEQRFMFDGAAAAPVADAAATAAAAEAHAAVANAIADAPAPVEVRAADPAKDGGKKEVVFVDTSVADYKSLEAGIRDGVAVVEIDGAKDGLAQIAQWAQTNSGYDSISILGHGEQATLHLGTTTLTSASLTSTTVQTELAEIGQSLTSDGDLMLYGCDVAKGSEGEAFIAALASATGADVAASSDATGAQAKGGDWVLETATGIIDAESLASSDYQSVLSEISFSSNDTDIGYYEKTSFTRTETQSGKDITFTSGRTGGLSYDDSGLYAIDSSNNGIDLTITAPTGYSFNIESFDALMQTEQLRVDLTYANGRTAYFSQTGISKAALSRQNSFECPLTDVTQVRLTSADYGVVNNFVINNVKAPPSFSDQYSHSFYDTEVANSFGNVSGTLTATPVGSAYIAAYGISGTTAGGTNIGGTYYDISQEGTYGTLYVRSGSGAYVYVPNPVEIEKLSTRMDGTFRARVTRVDSFTVTATDRVGATATNAVRIDITGQNDTPEIRSGDSATVAENGSGTVYTADGSDRDSGQTITYKLSGADAALFTIDPSTGKVSFKDAPDFEKPADSDQNNVYDIEVTATDNAAIVNGFPDNNDSAPKAVHITVTDANDAPTGGDKTVSTTEDSTYSFKTSDFAFTDADAGTTPHAFSAIELSALPNAGKLWLDANGDGIDNDTALAVGAKINASDIAAGKLKFSPAADANGAAYANFSFKVSDGTANATDASKITIDVAAVNDKPTEVKISKTTVSTFDGANAAVGILSATDPDNTSWTYTIVSVDGGSALLSLRIDGNTLVATDPRQLGTAEHKVVVRATDADGLSCNQELTITADNALTVTTATDEAYDFDNPKTYEQLRGGAGLSLAEAIGFANTNPDVKTIRFADVGPTINIPDNTTFSIEHTLTLDFGSAHVALGGGLAAALGATLIIKNDAGGAVVMNSAIEGSCALEKQGAGSLTLAGASYSYSKPTTISGGELIVSGTGHFSEGAEHIVVGKDAKLTLGRNMELTRLEGMGTVNLLPNATLAIGYSDSTFAGKITGSGSLVKAGGGTLTLTGANSYEGTTTISNGTLVIAGDANLGKGALTLSGGSLQVTAADASIDNAIAVNNKATIITDQTLSLSGSISGSGSLTKGGSGTLTLTGNNDYSGNLTVFQGTLKLAGGSALADTCALTVYTGATLKLAAAETIGSLADSYDGGGSVDLGGLTLTVGGNGSTEFSGVISGSGTLVKAGSGTLTLGGANNTSGWTTTVQDGTLAIAGDANLGGGAVSLADGTTLAVTTDATIDNAVKLTGSVTLDTQQALTLSGIVSGTGSLVKTGPHMLTLSGANSYDGTTTVSRGELSIASDDNLGKGYVRLEEGATLSVSTEATIGHAIELASGNATIGNIKAVTLSGTISGSGTLVKQYRGTLTLAGVNSYSGGTAVNGGTLAIAGDAKLGTGTVTLYNSATLALSGTTTIANAIVLTGDATTIVTDSGAVATLSGTVSGTTLTKSGDGTLILFGGAPKSFNVTRVTGGTLQVNTTLGGAVSAQAGTTVCGRGSVSSSLTIESGATLAPGAASGGVGKLMLNGGLVLNGTLAVDIAGDTSCDAISANGISYGTDSAISVTCLGGYAPTGATVFRLIDNSGTTNGEFKGLAPGALYKSGDNDFTVSYRASGSSGSSSLVFTSLPRPAVSGVTSSAGDGLHKIGDVVTISVAFDRAVNVAGTPTLLLETGTTDRVARYLSGSGTGVLTFSYTVQAGDTAADLDYASTGALALAGGTIADAATGKPAVLTLAAPGVTGSLAASKAIVIDGNAPTASIVLSDTSLKIGDTATVTITFSEAVTGFTVDDLTVANGTLNGLSTSDNITWSATFRPNAGISDTSKVITLANAGVTDLAGNAGAGVTASASYAVDTLRPTATIVVADSVLAAGETSQVTITFSEAVTGFTSADLTVASGTLSGLSSSDGGVTWSATFTPSADVSDTSNLITLSNSGVNDLAGNAGTDTTDSNNYAVSTVRPTATVVVADPALKAGETSLVTITFSEAVTGFTNDDLAVANGTLSPVTSTDGGITWTATLTPGDHVADSSNVITLDTAGVTSVAGSRGSGTTNSNNYAIDSVRPTATIVLADRSLTIGETTQVTITFSEAVSGFDASDLTVANGTLSGLASTDSGITWAATFTPTADVTDTSNVITLNDHSVENGSGNANSGTATSANYAVLTARTLSYSATTLAEATANDGSISTTVTITLANESFSGADGGALGTVGNVPAGLSAQLVKVDATHARLSLTGKAGAHSNAQDINNLTVSFGDADFVGSPATKVAGATTTLAIDFADPAAVPVPPVVDTVVAPPTVVSPPVVIPPPVVVLPPVAVTPSAPVTPVTPVTPQTSATPEPLGETVQFIMPTSPLTLAASPVTESTLASLAAPQLVVAPPAPTAALAPAETTRAPAPDAAQSDAARAPATVTASVAENGAPVLTQGGGFQVVVATGSTASPAGDLVVNRGVADQTVASGTMSQFAIPADAFAVSNVGAVVTLTARQSDGAPLPPWVRFDPASGKFEGQPPQGFSGEISIRVTARDAQGHEAVATFKVKVGEKAGRAQPERAGRAGLAEQLRLAGRPHPALERLARLAAWRNAA